MRFLSALLPALIAAPAWAEPPRVVADIAPVHALVAQVMDGVAMPELLLDQDANPHSVQLKPSQARMLAEADLLVWVGPGLSPWLGRIADSQGSDQIVLMEEAATRVRDFARPDAAGDDAGHGEGGDHGSDGQDHGGEDHGEDHVGEDHSGHDHIGQDPHVWLSTENARAWLGIFAEALSARDPDNAGTYRANAAKAVAGLDRLTADIAARLAPHRGAEIVTFHDSFGYFADQFGLVVVGSVRPGDAAAPSAAAMAGLRDLVASHDIACAFAEPGFDPALLDAVAGGTGLRIGLLDPTGALQPAGPGQYAATLRAVAEGIAGCLEGG